MQFEAREGILITLFHWIIHLRLYVVPGLAQPASVSNELTLPYLQESDNEMVISDVDTGEFIAKKIIYD